MVLRFKRAADIVGDFDLLLNAASGNQSRVKLGEHFVERELDENAIAIGFG
jgi:hypothetical protein